MERKLEMCKIEKLYEENEIGKVDFKFECIKGIQSQRNLVWKIEDSRKFIDSLLRNYPISSCCKTIIDGKTSIMDGQQRLRSTIMFINNEFSLDKDAKDVGDFEIKGRKFKDLDKSLQDIICQREIIFESITADLSKKEDIIEITEMFVRLNNGKDLTNMEKFRVSLGSKIKFINEIVENDLFNKITNLNIERFKHQEIALNFLMLDTNGNTGLSKTEKLKFIEIANSFGDFDERLKEAVLAKINYLNSVFERDEYLSLKKKERYLKPTHIAQLYLLSKHAMRNHITAEKFFKWTHDFFYLKKEAKNEYWIRAGRDSGNNKSSVQAKYKILLKSFNKAFKIK